MSDIVISVEHLSKRYRLGQIGATSLRESAERWLHRLRGRDPEREMGTVGISQSPQSSQRLQEVSSSAESPRGDSAEERSTSSVSSVSSVRDNELWALRDVSFEVKRGEVLGIIGKNGAGKSTLLKILSRITEPTSGRAILRGRVGSLLEVGTGFHPELTGRENVYLSGAILGMKKAEVSRKFDETIFFVVGGRALIM